MRNALSTSNRVARAIVSMGVTNNSSEAATYIEKFCGYDALYTKAALGAITSDDVGLPGTTTADYVREAISGDIFGPMLPFALRIGFNEIYNSAAVVSANFVMERRPIPLSKSVLVQDRLARLKICSLSVLSLDALKSENAEVQFLRAHQAEIGKTAANYFLDATNNGFEYESPASIAYGAATITASGDPAASARALLKNFRNLNSSFCITDPETGAQLALHGAAFADAGARGGTLGGVPLLTTTGSPRDSSGGQIVLVDASAVAISMGGMIVSKDTEGSIEMRDAFDSDADGTMISLFQTDSVAFRTTSYINWKLCDPAAVRVLTACDW